MMVTMTEGQNWTRPLIDSPSSTGLGGGCFGEVQGVIFGAFNTVKLQLSISQGFHLESGELVDAFGMINYKQSTNRAHELLNNLLLSNNVMTP